MDLGIQVRIYVKPANAALMTITGDDTSQLRKQRIPMLITSKLAIAIAVAGPLAVATASQSSAASLSSPAVVITTTPPAAVVDVVHRGYAPTGCDPYYGSVWSGVAPYSSNACPDPYYGTYWDGWAPY